jgi:hypothetical protein
MDSKTRRNNIWGGLCRLAHSRPKQTFELASSSPLPRRRRRRLLQQNLPQTDSCAAVSPCRPSNRVRRDGSLIAAVFFGLALCGPVVSTACARRRWLLRAVQSRRNRGSAADSHPADSPAMAVPETLCHPFATAKIVVWPGTCSVRGGLIIAAGSRDACGDATLCACRRRGERTGKSLRPRQRQQMSSSF